MPGLQQPTVLDRLHAVCRQVVAASSHVSIDAEAVQRLAGSLDPAQVRAAGRGGNMFPIKFESQESEVTFLALYHLLDFGSGYNPELLATSRRDARETIQFGAIGLALGSQELDVHWMRSFSAYSVHSAFGFDPRVEVQVQPGITMSRPGPLAPYAQALRQVVNEAGTALDAAGERSLGQHILRFLDGLVKAGKPLLAATLVEDLAATFTGFQDEALVAVGGRAADAAADAATPAAFGGTGGGSDGAATTELPVVVAPLLRKAQALAAALSARFGVEDERFRWADVDKLAADSGSWVAAALRHYDVLRLSDPLAAAVDAGQPLEQGGAAEVALRCAAVAGAQAVAAAAAAAAPGGAFSGAQVGVQLLALADEGGELHGRLHPHLTPGTLAY